MGMLYEIHVEVFAVQDWDADDEAIESNEADLMRHLEEAARSVVAGRRRLAAARCRHEVIRRC